MTQPEQRPQNIGEDRWTPSQVAAVGFLIQAEQELAEEFVRALDQWFDGIRNAVLPGRGTPWASIDPLGVMGGIQRWARLMGRFAERAIARVIARAYEQVLGEGYPFTSRPWVAQHLETVQNRMVRTPDEVFDLIRRELDEGINRGESIPELAERVDEQLLNARVERWRNRATVVARTEALSAHNGGTQDAFAVWAEEFDMELEKVWLASMDHRTRDSHFAADGQRVPLHAPFTVGGFPAMYPGDPTLPPGERINCLTGDSRITAGRFTKAYRRWYEGEVVLVELDSGERFTASPNHPVLTPRGWVGAGNLQRGEHLVGGALADDRTSGGPDVQAEPPTAAQLYDALAQAGVTRRLRGHRVDFHGDGTNSDVEVVLADRELVIGLDSPLGQQRYEAVLTAPDLAYAAARAGLQPMERTRPAAYGGVGGGNLPGARLGPHARPLHPLSFPPATELNLRLGQAAQDRLAADLEPGGEFVRGLPLQVELHQVVRVKRDTFHGYLYNFETASGAYIGSGVINHNCRCSVLYVEPGEEVDMRNRGMYGDERERREVARRHARGIIRARDN